MTSLMDIHSIVQEELRKRYVLQPVKLKHPFPERPVRALKFMNINGEVFSTDKLLRIVFIRPDLPFYFAVRSMFIRPRVELDLPVFAGEVMRTGKKKMVIVDIHRTGMTHHDDSALFGEMLKIQERYPELMKYTKRRQDAIQEVFSKAACQVVIPEEMGDQVINLWKEYLNLFCDMVDRAQPVAGEELKKTQEVFEDYLKKLVNHDPGVGMWKILFGKQGGVERSMDMHFGR
jgi:hypothetical protein